MVTKNKQVAVIGLGDICRKAYLPILSTYKGIDLTLFNRSSNSLAEMQGKYRIRNGTTDLAQIIDNRPDMAFVLTASTSHYSIIKQLLENDIDVYVEKPATLHSWETEELAELAESRGRILMVGFNRRFAPMHVKAKEMWGGQMVSMGIFQKNRSNASHPTLEHQVIDDTIHQVDTLRFYCGDGHAVSTTQQALPDKLLGAVSTIRLDNGGIGIIETNLQAGGWQEKYEIYGGQQSMQIDAFAKVKLTQGPEQRQWEETYSSSWQTILDGRGFVGQIEHFFACVENRSVPLTSAWESVKTQRLAEEIIHLGK